MILKNNNELKQENFKNEKELQTFFEKNMDKILNVKFIETEFAVGNFRIDSLGFDKETNSFRIIEYKNVKNHSLVDQGYTYLKLMLERKADFVLKYNEITKSNLTIKDVDWSQSRIIFVSTAFTPYQLNATDFVDIPVDLIKVTKYDDNIIEIDFIKKMSNVKIENIQNNDIKKSVNKEIIVYSEEDHTRKLSNQMKVIYENLKQRILDLGDIDVDVKKYYIAFKGRTNIVDVHCLNGKINLTINIKKGLLNDPVSIAKDISNIGHWGNGDYRVDICTEEDIDNVIPLIKQSLKVNGK